MDCIPSTEEKYSTFSKKIKVATSNDLETKYEKEYYTTKFIDSFRFMQLSLAKLANNLQEDDFINLKKIYKTNTNF